MSKNNIKRLISFLLLESRNNSINTIIGYLNTLKVHSWDDIINSLIKLDFNTLRIFELDTTKQKDIIDYGISFNKCYGFINEEHSIPFIIKPPFDNNRVANIKEYNNYVISRKTYLNEYIS